MDAVREDMSVVEMMEEDVMIQPNGEGKSDVATPGGRSRKKKKKQIKCCKIRYIIA